MRGVFYKFSFVLLLFCFFFTLTIYGVKKEIKLQICYKDSIFNTTLRDIGFELKLDSDLNLVFSLDKDLFDEKLTKNLFNKLINSKDAEIKETEKGYIIIDEIYGNEIKLEELRVFLKSYLRKIFMENPKISNIKVEIPDYCIVQPNIKKEDLVSLCDQYNKYFNKKVIYKFGSEEVIVSYSDIRNWISFNEDSNELVLDRNCVYDYVNNLKSTHDTAYVYRDFNSTLRGNVLIDYSTNTYGYLINVDAETEELYTAIESEEEIIEREPIYDQVGYHGRNYNDDLLGTYVEVDILDQMVYCYKDYNLIASDNCVTGNVANGTETDKGAFYIYDKQSPSTLRGYNSDGSLSYANDVSFWMPFNGGEGLHDANWRWEFGGEIYQWSGSHGCVNLPYYLAEVIYNNMDIGTPVIVF